MTIEKLIKELEKFKPETQVCVKQADISEGGDVTFVLDKIESAEDLLTVYLSSTLGTCGN